MLGAKECYDCKRDATEVRFSSQASELCVECTKTPKSERTGKLFLVLILYVVGLLAILLLLMYLFSGKAEAQVHVGTGPTERGPIQASFVNAKIIEAERAEGTQSAVDKAKEAVGMLRKEAGMAGIAGGEVWVFPRDVPNNAHSYAIASVYCNVTGGLILINVACGSLYLGKFEVDVVYYNKGPTNPGWWLKYKYPGGDEYEPGVKEIEVTLWWPNDEE